MSRRALSGLGGRRAGGLGGKENGIRVLRCLLSIEGASVP